MRRRVAMPLVVALLAATACTGASPKPTPTASRYDITVSGVPLGSTAALEAEGFGLLAEVQVVRPTDPVLDCSVHGQVVLALGSDTKTPLIICDSRRVVVLASLAAVLKGLSEIEVWFEIGRRLAALRPDYPKAAQQVCAGTWEAAVGAKRYTTAAAGQLQKYVAANYAAAIAGFQYGLAEVKAGNPLAACKLAHE